MPLGCVLVAVSVVEVLKSVSVQTVRWDQNKWPLWRVAI